MLRVSLQLGVLIQANRVYSRCWAFLCHSFTRDVLLVLARCFAPTLSFLTLCINFCRNRRRTRRTSLPAHHFPPNWCPCIPISKLCRRIHLHQPLLQPLLSTPPGVPGHRTQHGNYLPLSLFGRLTSSIRLYSRHRSTSLSSCRPCLLRRPSHIMHSLLRIRRCMCSQRYLHLRTWIRW